MHSEELTTGSGRGAGFGSPSGGGVVSTLEALASPTVEYKVGLLVGTLFCLVHSSVGKSVMLHMVCRIHSPAPESLE